MRKILVSILLIAPLFAAAYTSPGAPTGFVNDFAGLFSAEEKAALETKLAGFQGTSSNEIAVATVETLGGETVEYYAVELFEEWQIGKEKEDNGVLILIAKDEREVRIEVGYGLEGALTDALASDIIRNVMVPELREDRYFDGVDKAVDAIILATAGEYVPQEGATESFPWQSIIFPLLFIPIWLGSVLARSKSWWAGGVLGAVGAIVVSIFLGFLYFGLIAFIILIPFGLLFDYAVSKAYRQSAARGGTKLPWWTGGGHGGGFGGGGGGFGGFGGGSSGGGGASGRF